MGVQSFGADKREEARWAQAQLEAHDQRRRTLGFERHVPTPSTVWDRDTDAPPPALVHHDDAESLNQGYGAVGSPEQRADSGAYSAAPDKWASRFRDGLPPPPPPPPPITDRDVMQIMQQLGIDPRDPRARNVLDDAVERGRLGTDPQTGRPFDLYGFIRAQQRVSQKKRQRRAQLDPSKAALSRQHPLLPHLSHPNDRSGGGPMAYPDDPSSYVAPVRSSPGGSPQRGTSGGPSEPLSQAAPPLPGQPVYERSPAPPSAADFRTDQESPLTQSQKRRLRRKRQRQGPGTVVPPTPMPNTDSILPPDLFSPVVPTEYRNGHTPLPPDPENPESYPPVGHHACGASVSVQFAVHEPPTNLICPLNPYPHPEQPHLIVVPTNLTGGIEVFIGWFDPAESVS